MRVKAVRFIAELPRARNARGEAPLLRHIGNLLDCLQSAFSLKIRLALISSSAIENQDVIITITDWDQTRKDGLLNFFCSKQTLRQPRNGVIDWSIAQLLTDNWLVCGEIASNRNSHASQPTANYSEPNSNLTNKTFKGYLTGGNCCKFPKGKRIQGNLTGFKESVIFSVDYVLFINRLKLLGFIWLIKLPWQLCCPQTKQQSFFLMGITPSFLAARGFAARVLRFRVQ